MSDQVTRGDLKEENSVEQESEMSQWHVQEFLSTL
jgi:hypothetical protein